MRPTSRRLCQPTWDMSTGHSCEGGTRSLLCSSLGARGGRRSSPVPPITFKDSYFTFSVSATQVSGRLSLRQSSKLYEDI